jgi:hypothetical protein
MCQPLIIYRRREAEREDPEGKEDIFSARSHMSEPPNG